MNEEMQLRLQVAQIVAGNGAPSGQVVEMSEALLAWIKGAEE